MAGRAQLSFNKSISSFFLYSSIQGLPVFFSIHKSTKEDEMEWIYLINGMEFFRGERPPAYNPQQTKGRGSQLIEDKWVMTAEPHLPRMNFTSPISSIVFVRHACPFTAESINKSTPLKQPFIPK